MADIRYVTGGIAALIIAVIIIATVAVPIIEDQASGASYRGQNSGYDVRYTDVTGKAIEWTKTGGTATVTIDGVTVESPIAGTGISVISDGIILRASSTGGNWYDITSSKYASVHGASVTMTLTVTAAGAYTFTTTEDTPTTKTGTLTKILVSTADGPIGHFVGGAKATLGDTVYAGNFGSMDTKGPVRFQPFVNGVQGEPWFTPWNTSSGDIVTADPVTYDMDYSSVGEGQQVGMYSGCTTTSGSVTSTVLDIYAPIDYHSTAVEGSGGINQTLIAVVPLLLFVVAVMVAVRLIRDV